MEKRITIYDIAKQLNISTATVNRALNGKSEVNAKTRKLVLATAEQMGFKVNRLAKSLSRNTVKLGCVIDYVIPAFHDSILQGINEAYAELADFNVSLECYPTRQPMHLRRQEILDKMREMADDGVSGILVLPSSDTRGYHELFSEFAERNIKVATVCSDVLGSSRVFSLRQDAFMSGRLAAELLYWFAPQKNVAVFTGYNEVGVHAEVVEGFVEEAGRRQLNIIGVFENHDDGELAYRNTERILTQYPQIEGIYINTANSSAVCKKITEMGLAGKVKIVASDIFPEIKDYMMADVIHASIFQDSVRQGREALRYLYEVTAEAGTVEKDILIKPQVILKSNLQAFL